MQTYWSLSLLCAFSKILEKLMNMGCTKSNMQHWFMYILPT
jgi:hypothetical protein